MKKNRNKGILIAVAALAVVIAAMLILNSVFKEKTQAGNKHITVEVVHKDGSSKEFEYQSTKEYLGEVLEDEKLVEGEKGQYGLFIKTVDGETVPDGSKDWWCITKNGEMLSTSADQTPIADGEHYEITLTAE